MTQPSNKHLKLRPGTLPHPYRNHNNPPNTYNPEPKGKQLSLPVRRTNNLRVPLSAEAHTRILRLPAKTWEVAVEGFFDGLTELIEGRFHAPAHFEVVCFGEVVDGVGVWGAVGGVGLESCMAGEDAGFG